MAKDNKITVLPDAIPDVKFNLKAQEQFANDKGVTFEHWAAIPSPIGKKARGDYRRPDSLDTIAEGGFIYKKIGEFKATVVGNTKSHQIGGAVEAGVYDNSVARIIIPKFYSKMCTKKKEISLLPGDRIYAKDIELKVDNYQEAEFTPRGADVLQFPVQCVDILEDSNGNEYAQGKHFKINKDGNIKWIQGRKNPGIDPETGKGRVYSVRYTYLAFWYIQQLVNEIRITNTEDGEPTRLPYHAVIQREYIYHNKTRGDAKETNIETHTERTKEEPTEELNPDQFEVKVDIRNFE